MRLVTAGFAQVREKCLMFLAVAMTPRDWSLLLAIASAGLIGFACRVAIENL